MPAAQKPASHDVKPIQISERAGTTATETVESDLNSAFKHFAELERRKVQDSRRSRQSADKAVRVNDLKKFAKNFKLLTPVPKDLVPILAKDEDKQKEIVRRAQAIADGATKTSSSGGQITPGRLARLESDVTSPSTRRQPTSTLPTGQLPAKTPVNVRENVQAPVSGPGQRSGENRRNQKQGPLPTMPAPLPIQDARGQPHRPSALSSAVQSPQRSMNGPPSATSIKFNVQATEFKPNPAASAFKPSSISNTPAASSPSTRPNTRAISPNAPLPHVPMPNFLRDSKAARTNPRESMDDKPVSSLSVIKTAPQAPQGGQPGKVKSPVSEGPSLGSTVPFEEEEHVQRPYRKGPNWTLSNDQTSENSKTYAEEFISKSRSFSHASASSRASPLNPNVRQPQMPFHGQNGFQTLPQVPTHQHMPPQIPAPQHYGQGHYFEDPRSRQASMSSYVGPSPRIQNANVVYMAAMPPPISQAQPMTYAMHTPMTPRQYSNGPHMSAAQGSYLAAPVMVPSPSAGYMPQPMMPFNPHAPYGGPVPVYGTPQTPNGYPSPGRNAPMMTHSASHQGHNPQGHMSVNQYAQPMYGQPGPGQSKLYHHMACTANISYQCAAASTITSHRSRKAPTSSTAIRSSLTARQAMDTTMVIITSSNRCR